MKAALVATAIFLVTFFGIALVTAPLGWIGGYEALLIILVAGVVTALMTRRRRSGSPPRDGARTH
jgi:membrane protein implicated in regulation of membrane protease activity